MFATLDDLKRHVIYAGGKISFGSDAKNTMTEADAELFLEDSLALMEQKHEDIATYTGKVKTLLVREQCLETFIMIVSSYSKNANQLESLHNEIDRIEYMINIELNTAISVKGGTV